MKTLNNKLGYILFFVLIVILFTGCANVVSIEECVTEAPSGFFSGLLHGLIAPFTFVGSLFSDSIAIYAVNNNGWPYDFGFVLSAGILFGGGRKTRKKRA